MCQVRRSDSQLHTKTSHKNSSWLKEVDSPLWFTGLHVDPATHPSPLLGGWGLMLSASAVKDFSMRNAHSLWFLSLPRNEHHHPCSQRTFNSRPFLLKLDLRWLVPHSRNFVMAGVGDRGFVAINSLQRPGQALAILLQICATRQRHISSTDLSERHMRGF